MGYVEHKWICGLFGTQISGGIHPESGDNMGQIMLQGWNTRFWDIPYELSNQNSHSR